MPFETQIEAPFLGSRLVVLVVTAVLLVAVGASSRADQL